MPTATGLYANALLSSHRNYGAKHLESLAREAVIIGTIISQNITGSYGTIVLDEGSGLSKMAKERKYIYLRILY